MQVCIHEQERSIISWLMIYRSPGWVYFQPTHFELKLNLDYWFWVFVWFSDFRYPDNWISQNAGILITKTLTGLWNSTLRVSGSWFTKQVSEISNVHEHLIVLFGTIVRSQSPKPDFWNCFQLSAHKCSKSNFKYWQGLIHFCCQTLQITVWVLPVELGDLTNQNTLIHEV